MAILVVCPGCKKSFNVDDKFAGKTGPCPKCKTKITIPEKTAEVKIHTPDEFSGGGKGVTGKLLLKPIARQETRIKPVMAAVIGGAVAAAIAWALVVRFVAPEAGMLRYLLSGIGLLLVSPPLAVAAYTFLRDDELEAYRGKQLYIRAAVCAAGLHDSVGRVRLCEGRRLTARSNSPIGCWSPRRSSSWEPRPASSRSTWKRPMGSFIMRFTLP